ncbi:MAG: transketolase [Alphaproteobacteria bacterium]|nr:transketolase [Alphaproteobacteria bacterium]
MVLHSDLANAVRFLGVEAVEKAHSGHPGIVLGAADIATTLFKDVLRIAPNHPDWINRDRFVLSAGHGAPLLYSLLYLTGYEDATLEGLKSLRQLDSKMAGHPEYGALSGIETTTGPLGQGLATSVGIALSERLAHNRFGDIIDYYTYALVGDGCLMEGISEEAISFAGHLKLNKLIVLWDNNSITIDGETSLSTETNQCARFEANGWNTIKVDGHNAESLFQAMQKAKESDKPTFISCKTIIGLGAPKKAGTSGVHGAPLGEEELKGVRRFFNWKEEPFSIPDNILNEWRKVAKEGDDAYQEWAQAFSKLPKDLKERMTAYYNRKIPDSFEADFKAFKETLLKEDKPLATRKASQKTLEVLVPLLPRLIGGSADLTPANYTKTPSSTSITKDDFSGNYINYGIREHLMAAVMNGISVSKAFIPYGGTFLAFLDYLKPALRLSALMKRQVIYVLTHDSIGVGEDGPTHQPIEQLASVRAMPNILVMRPADCVEVAECWELALKTQDKPSILALSRQALPRFRTTVDENLSQKGGYIASKEKETRQATLLATGSEVSLALEAQKLLWEKGVDTAVVSMPCLELFDEQDKSYQKEVLGTAPRVFIEALSSFGLHKYVGDNGKVVSMTSFGASAPEAKLKERFGFTPKAIVEIVSKMV